MKDGHHDDGGGNKESGGGGGGDDDTVNDADEDAGNEKAGDGAVFQYFPVRLPDMLHEEGEQEEEGKRQRSAAMEIGGMVSAPSFINP